MEFAETRGSAARLLTLFCLPGCLPPGYKTMTNSSFGRAILASCALGGAAISAFAAGTPSATTPAASSSKAAPQDSKWVFSLLPKAFQRNPRIDLSVITEYTELGKKVALPTVDKPYYYLAQSGGFHAEGHGVQDQTPVEVDKLQQQLKSALAGNGYVEASEGHPATLVLFFFWGVHNRLDEEYDDLGNRNLLSRAKLVGGEKFAAELLKVLEEESMTAPIGGDLMDPLHRFIERDDLTRQLMEQTFDDCYYLVISCYEGAAMAKGERHLLWRTKMSTAAQGIGMKESMPALLAGGTPFLGRPMDGPAVVDKQIHREGNVKIGEPQVKEYIEPAKK